MARFIAVHNVPGITEADFRDKLDAVRKWRPDRRTTILKVYGDLENGKLISECEAVEQSHFEDWMKLAGSNAMPKSAKAARNMMRSS